MADQENPPTESRVSRFPRGSSTESGLDKVGTQSLPTGDLPKEDQKPAPYRAGGSGAKPAIRTMESDIQEFLKTAKPSLIKIVSQELDQPPTQEEKKGISRKRAYWITSALFLSAAGLLGILWWVFYGRVAEPETPAKLVPSAPYFAVEAARTVSIKAGDRTTFLRLMKDAVREPEREGIIKRVIIKIRDGPQERFAALEDFFEFYGSKPPEGLLRSVEPTLMVFVYARSNAPHLGLALRAKEPNRTLASMLSWERTIIPDLSRILLGEAEVRVTAPFEDRTYRNIDWRYIKLSEEKDMGIGYFVFPARNVLVITASKESAEEIIDRLFDQ